MPYTLKFSDSTKIAQITVPDMPPGINTIDTSLSLVGRGYPNYGEKVAGNFLHLLENFAGPISPQNPIEGQLWYDTSDPTNKVLRIMDGTATSARWPSANGIYQQSTDPKNSPSVVLKAGDIWVNTLLNQLSIYTSPNWTVVGPSVGTGGSKTGAEASVVQDTLGIDHAVIKNYVDGQIISITAKDNFIPNPVISGFPSLLSGVNLTTGQSSIFNGTAKSSLALQVNGNDYDSSTFLRKNDPVGQTVTGKIIFQYGVVVSDSVTSSDFVQLYKSSSDGILLNNISGGKILIKNKSPSGGSISDTLSIQSGIVGINTSTNINSPNLDVNGTVRISSGLTILSTASDAVVVSGSVNVGSNINVTNNLNVLGITTSTGQLHLGTSSGNGAIIVPNNNNTYDIGAVSNTFRSLYVSDIYTSRINGAATSFPGMITVYGGRTAPPGWALCDGSNFTTSTNVTLFSVIGYTYGGSGATAKLPNMSTSTYVSTGTNTGTYLKYIIKL
jgi:hypothetical protein